MGSAGTSGVSDEGVFGPTARRAVLYPASHHARSAILCLVLAGAVILAAYEIHGTVTRESSHAFLLINLAPTLGMAFALSAVTLVMLLRPGHDRQSRALQDAPESFAPAFDAIPHGLARWSHEGRLICANAAFSRHLRLNASIAQAGADYRAVIGAVAGRVSTQPVVEYERQRLIEVERPDGSVVTLDERPCPRGGFVTIVTDVTERRAADRMLALIRDEQRQLASRYHEEKVRAEAASRAKSAFLAHLSHDIRTPLNHIIGFADMIRMEAFGPLGDDTYRNYIENIKSSGEHLLDRFAEILEFAELESGSKRLAGDPVDLTEFFNATRKRYTRQAARAGVRLQIAARVPGEVHGDRHYLDRMLGNLIDNAIRHTPRGGEIRMVGWTADDGVVIELTDTGAGIAPDTLSQLSQPFVLNDAAFAKSHDGIGLGIAMARTIAELSGGRLAIDSMEGVGTTVAICLPLHMADGEARDDRQAA